MERHELKMICSQICELIKNTNNENVYDNIISFFNLTSQLFDCRSEIEAMPVAQQEPTSFMRFLNPKKAEKIDKTIQDQKEEKDSLCRAISITGRWPKGHNRTIKGEKVTKEKVYFGLKCLEDGWHNLAELETYRRTEPKIYNSIASQMTMFVKKFNGYFDKTDWL